MNGLGWKKADISFFPPIGRTSTRRKISPLFSQPSTGWQKSLICRCSTPVTPGARKRLEASGFALDPRVIRHEPLGFHDYNCLQMNAFCVVSDSGTLPEESSFFTSVGHPFPAVCIRTSTERPEALDRRALSWPGSMKRVSYRPWIRQ